MSSPRRPRRFVHDSFWLTALAVLAAAASTPQPSAAQLLPLPLPPLLPGNDPSPNQPPPPAPEQPPPPAPEQPPAPQQPPPPSPQPPPSSPPEQPPPSSPTPAESSSAGAARFEETDLALATEGAWQKRGPEVAAFSGGTATSSAAREARATFAFTGSSVVWLGLKCNVCGIASVSIDGGPATSVDTAGSAAPGSPSLKSEPVFSAARLAAGSHTLTITVTGTTSTSGAHVVVDAFDVGVDGASGQQSPSPPAETIVDDGGAGSGDALSLALLAASVLLRRRDLSRDHPNSHSEGRSE